MAAWNLSVVESVEGSSPRETNRLLFVSVRKSQQGVRRSFGAIGVSLSLMTVQCTLQQAGMVAVPQLNVRKKGGDGCGRKIKKLD